MKEIIITSRQRMIPPDQFAYELGLIPTPDKIENSRIASYVLIGVFVTVAIGIITYAVFQNHIENKRENIN